MQPMQWLFDIILEMVANAGYALKTWVLAQLCTSTIRVYRTSNQAIAKTTWTRIAFNGENWDVNGEFANYKFTAKEAGYFQVNLAAVGISMTAGKIFMVGIYKNGGQHCSGRRGVVLTDYQSCILSDIVYLDGEGDYIEGRVYHSDVGIRNIFGHTTYTFMSIHQLSKDSWK